MPKTTLPLRYPALLLLLVAWSGCEGVSGSDPDRSPSAAYELPFGPSPFAPVEARVEGRAWLAPDELNGSARCGACHSTILAQWESSLHRASAEDHFYRFAVDRMAVDYGVAATRLCVGCHDPGLLLSGGVDRAAAKQDVSRSEGVSCLSCHLVTATHASPQTGAIANAAYTITPLPDNLLFPAADADPAALEAHARALRRPFLSENRFCDSCHRFFVPTQLAGTPAGRLRLQSEEALGTPFGDPAHPAYQSCVDCHMPLVEGEDPAARKGKIHDHRALGANQWLPALAGDTRHAAETLRFRQAGAVDLEVQPLRWSARGDLELPVRLVNRKNGHDFPTGATDISEAWLELTLVDARERVVFESPGLDERGYLSPEAPSLNSLLRLGGGELDFLHDLLSQVQLARHPRIRPGGSQLLSFRVPFAEDAAEDAAAPLRARVRLKARHGNALWNDWTFNYQDVEVTVATLAQVEVPVAPPPPRPEVAAPPPPPPPPPAPEGMVFVPGGTYRIGADPREDAAADLIEYPPHDVEVRPFFLDRTPVTNREYLRAVEAGIVPAPDEMVEVPLYRHSWKQGRYPAGTDEHPAVLVTLEEARAYCRWQGKRLPSETEWEAAARGPGGRRFPWGDRFDPALCNTAEAGRRMTVPVGSQPANASPAGALDMGCNVAEWVEGTLLGYPRQRNVDNRGAWVSLFGTGSHLTRGASYDVAWDRARASNRGPEEIGRRKLIGIRCAQDAPAEAP